MRAREGSAFALAALPIITSQSGCAWENAGHNRAGRRNSTLAVTEVSPWVRWLIALRGRPRTS